MRRKVRHFCVGDSASKLQNSMEKALRGATTLQGYTRLFSPECVSHVRILPRFAQANPRIETRREKLIRNRKTAPYAVSVARVLIAMMWKDILTGSRWIPDTGFLGYFEYAITPIAIESNDVSETFLLKKRISDILVDRLS